MNLIWILLIVLLVFAVVGAPTLGVWHHNFGWGPSGLVTIIVVVLLILLLTGRL